MNKTTLKQACQIVRNKMTEFGWHIQTVLLAIGVIALAFIGVKLYFIHDLLQGYTLPAHAAIHNSTEVPKDLYCPATGSVEYDQALHEQTVIDKRRTERLVVMYGGAKVHITPSGSMSGDIVVCGGGAMLVVEGTFTGRALVAGGGASFVSPTHVPDFSSHVWLDGASTEVIRCNAFMSTDNHSCNRYF